MAWHSECFVSNHVTHSEWQSKLIKARMKGVQTVRNHSAQPHCASTVRKRSAQSRCSSTWNTTIKSTLNHSVTFPVHNACIKSFVTDSNAPMRRTQRQSTSRQNAINIINHPWAKMLRRKMYAHARQFTVVLLFSWHFYFGARWGVIWCMHRKQWLGTGKYDRA